MKKNDFWFLSLIALFIIYIFGTKDIFIRIALIANSIIVLTNAVFKLKSFKSKK